MTDAPRLVSGNTGLAIGLVVAIVAGIAWSAGQVDNRMTTAEGGIKDLGAKITLLDGVMDDQDRRMIRIESKLDTLIVELAGTRGSLEELRRSLPQKRSP